MTSQDPKSLIGVKMVPIGVQVEVQPPIDKQGPTMTFFLLPTEDGVAISIPSLEAGVETLIKVSPHESGYPQISMETIT